MNSPDDNPYSEFTPEPKNAVKNNNDSKVKGFLIGWGLIMMSYVLCGFLLFILEDKFNFGLEEFITAALLCLFSPLLINGLIMLWHGIKGQRNVVIGNAISLASLIAAFLLLLAACYSIDVLSL